MQVRTLPSIVALALLASCRGDRADPVPKGAPAEHARASAPAVAPLPTLVLYDGAGTSRLAGDLFATWAGTLASHFGPWTAKPLSRYEAGELHRYRAAVYLGTDPRAVPPEAFLDDVAADRTPVLWMLGDIRRLGARAPARAAALGWRAGPIEATRPVAVEYRGERLRRNPADAGIVRGMIVSAGRSAQVLARAVRRDGSTFPWAVRAGKLLYVAENPFTYPEEGGRWLAAADLLFELLEPARAERHRALVRLEDVSPATPPASIRAFADALHALGVPFSIALVPVFEDPLGVWLRDGVARRLTLRDRPEVISALRYALDRGGTLVLHGYTHQYAATRNPYNGQSGSDYEFWRAHLAPDGSVVMDGPPAEDSAAWAADRVRRGLEEVAAAGLPAPVAFEYPHYAGSAEASRGIARVLPVAYHRGLYFPGLISDAADLTRPFEQPAPYVVKDVYGFTVLPENCAFYSPSAPPPRRRSGEDLVANARAARVVRDGFASFFFHPTFTPGELEPIVRGIQAAGYRFVSPAEALDGVAPGARLTPAREPRASTALER
jgi:uncharacterized protein YdaL